MTHITKVLLSSLSVVGLAATIAAPATAQTQTTYAKDPISVEAFSAYLNVSPAPSQWLDGLYIGGDASNVTISFVNTADVPAKSVEFAVRAGNHTSLIVDKGTFSPGARITHTFERSPDLVGATSVQVREVTFADGSSWQS
jgi:hypothetical protein